MFVDAFLVIFSLVSFGVVTWVANPFVHEQDNGPRYLLKKDANWVCLS
jgi:hypothetical protein